MERRDIEKRAMAFGFCEMWGNFDEVMALLGCVGLCWAVLDSVPWSELTYFFSQDSSQ